MNKINTNGRKYTLAVRCITEGVCDPLNSPETLCELYSEKEIREALEIYEIRKEAVSFDY